MKYIIKCMIGYIKESDDKNWSQVVQTKEFATEYNSKEEAEQYIKTYFTKQAAKHMKIEEYRCK